MKLSKSTISLSFGLLFSAFTQVQAQNCNCPGPTIISMLVFAPTTIGTPIQLNGHVLLINMVQGSTYEITNCGQSTQNTRIGVFNQAGNNVACNDNACGLQSRVQFTPSANGDYSTNITSNTCLGLMNNSYQIELISIGGNGGGNGGGIGGGNGGGVGNGGGIGNGNGGGIGNTGGALWEDNGPSIVHTTRDVGIGMNMPTEALEVLGNAKVNGVVESTTGGVKFPDGTTQLTAVDLQIGSDATFNDVDVTGRLKVGTSSIYIDGSLPGTPPFPNDNHLYTGAGSGHLYINSTSNTGFSNPGDLNAHTILNANHNGGNVGIGTTTPTNLLHVRAGQLDFATSRLGLRLEARYALIPTQFQAQASVWDIEPIIEPFAKLKIGTPTRRVMTLTGTGQVGIGTPDPEGTLHIIPSGSDEAIIIGDGPFESTNPQNSLTFTDPNTGSGDNGIRWLDGTGNFSSSVFGSTGANQEDLGLFSRGNITFATSSGNVERMRITSSGRVEIGTSQPHTLGPIRFVVQGSGNPGGLDFISTFVNKDKTGHLATVWDDSESTWRFRSSIGNNAIAFNITGTEVMRVHSNKNVGIGTEVPTSKLSILSDVGAFNSVLSIQSGTSSRWHLGVGDPGGQHFTIGALAGVVQFAVEAQSGNIGIGLKPFSWSLYKLDVCGSIRAKEVVVEAFSCDFVFEDGYNLRSIQEVEDFIEKNGHLPDIPPAKEVDENGIKVGDFQARLLQKIEELTLYVIEQDKRIQQLKLGLDAVEER